MEPPTIQEWASRVADGVAQGKQEAGESHVATWTCWGTADDAWAPAVTDQEWGGSKWLPATDASSSRCAGTAVAQQWRGGEWSESGAPCMGLHHHSATGSASTVDCLPDR